MSIWCKHCGMGEEGIEGCPGYSKLPHKECALYLPMRFDGSVNMDTLSEGKDK